MIAPLVPRETETRSRMLTALAEIFGEALTEVRLEGYLAALADVPLPALRLGLQRAAKTCTFFPKPAEIRTAVDEAQTSRVLSSSPAVRGVFCKDCRDVGMRYVSGNVVTRCDCLAHNPVIKQRCARATKYGAER